MNKQFTMAAIVAVLMSFVCPMTSWAQESVTIDGIKYELDDGKATVGSYNDVKGDLVIPSSVNYNGVDCAVTSIGNCAFAYCDGLTSMVIPEGVTSIGAGAFSDCDGLTSMVIPEGVTNIGEYAFYGCSGLTSVVIPASVTSIGEGAFVYCTRLAELNIPSSVTEIEYGAFERCNQLTSLTLSENFEKLGGQVFAGCSRLKTLYNKSAEPPYAEWNSFEGMAPKAVVYVPVGAKAAYEDAAGWQNLTIEEFDFTDVASPSIALPFTAYATSDGVVLSVVEGEVEVAVYSLQGVELYRGTVSGGETVVALPSGSYVVRAGNGQGTLVIVP